MAEEDVVKTTCARDCYDACGIAVYSKDGVVTKVLGDPDHAISRGKLCGKCAIVYNGAWRDETLRLKRPLRRTGAKGTGTFEDISWDEALAEIAGRFRAMIDAGEARTILHTHYTGTVALIGGAFPIRLFNRMGATEVDPDTVCNKAGHVALELDLRHLARRLRPAHGEGCAHHPDLGRQSIPFRAASGQGVRERGGGTRHQDHRRRSARPRHGDRGRHAPQALARHRRGACLRLPQRDAGEGIGRSSLPRRACAWRRGA